MLCKEQGITVIGVCCAYDVFIAQQVSNWPWIYNITSNMHTQFLCNWPFFWSNSTLGLVPQLRTHTHTTVFRPFFRDHPGEPVPQENFWTLWCKGRLTEVDTLTIRLGATPSGLTSAPLHHPPILWLPVNSSRGHVVTRSTRHQSTRHIIKPLQC